MKYSKHTLEDVLSSVNYDPHSGKFLLVTKCGTKTGKECGFISQSDGYRRISIRGKPALAHRVAWFIAHGHWPEQQIDHANGDRSDNRIANLRLATISEQRWNSKKKARNKSGFKGVCWDNSRKKWLAQIMANRRNHSIGRFDCIGQAIAAYRAKARQLHGEFARVE